VQERSLHLQIIEIPVKDVKRSAAWYREMFKLDYCFPYKEGDDGAFLNLNGIALGLIESQEIPKLEFFSMKGECKPVLTFQVNNIQALHEEMIGKGADVKEMIYKPGGGHSFQFLDLDGNLIGVWGGWPKE